MTRPAASEDTFIETMEQFGPTRTAEILGISVRSVFRRRQLLERRLGRRLKIPGRVNRSDVPGRLTYDIADGTVLVGSDAHYWPHHITTAHRAFVHFARKLKPKIVVMNGDVCDFASISRFSPIGWEHRPTVQQEIETCQERLDEIVKAAKNATFTWAAGNHDLRFESAVSKALPELARVQGVHLKDHFPEWQPCWAVWINPDTDAVVIKHRWRGGIHAVRTNTLNAGTHFITGHLHSLKATPITDYNGTRWGVDTGTLAEPQGPQFMDYTEQNPTDWRSGFVVLTFRNGRLLQPELVLKHDEDSVAFRGEIIHV